MTYYRNVIFYPVTLLLLLSSCESIAQVDDYQGAIAPLTPQIIYGQGIRETNWRSAPEERNGFHLPPGFEIKLFASEPQITKPLNMAWDVRGRLWVSNTVEYPYPAKDDAEPRDSIRILEDTDGDGQADKVTIFADKLNIPMGLLPVSDGVICFSIPYLWHLRDVDGDDRVDERIQLLGPFDATRDTHGMINALRRGFDGWIYACHGFNNQSKVTASDGSAVHLLSGNTFRFKQDGSRIEHYTLGQVNPFGMTQDEYGNWYTADCHSKPLTALLAGGCYPSFGRPHDGLGFAPSMMDHLHGSTAISGVAYYLGDHFPAPYRNLLFSGNVMTSRINCDRLRWQGATARAEELPDFLTSDDPWFRPVDVRLGPDGALYVADFYNKIIGHYEVPLEHPERDRDSGRIWRITYRGEQGHQRLAPLHASDRSATESSVQYIERLTGLLGSSNPVLRRAAIEQLVSSSEPVQCNADLGATDASFARHAVASVEVRYRRGELTESMIRELTESKSSSMPLIHILKMAIGWDRQLQEPLIAKAREVLSQALAEEQDLDHHLTKAAVELIGACGNADDVGLLLHLVQIFTEGDPTTAHVARISSRNLLRSDDVLAAVVSDISVRSDRDSNHELSRVLTGILPGVGTSRSAHQLLRYARTRVDPSSEFIDTVIAVVAKNGSPESIDQVMDWLAEITVDQQTAHASRFAQFCAHYRANHIDLADSLESYGANLLLDELLPELAALSQAIRSRDHTFPESTSPKNDKVAQLLKAMASILRTGCMKRQSAQFVAALETIAMSPSSRAGLLQHVAYGNGQAFVSTLIQQAIRLRRVDLIDSTLVGQPADTDLERIVTELCATAFGKQQENLARALLSTSKGCVLATKLLKQGQLSKIALAGAETQLPSALPAEVHDYLTRELASAAKLVDSVDVQQRVDNLDSSVADRALGKQLFDQHCANCHQLGGVGKLVGPQLDGARARGTMRLAEDILDPNRNVDRAFRQTILLLDDDSIVTGLAQDQSDGSTILTSQEGTSVTYSERQIADRKLSTTSLMPSNFNALLDDKQLSSLLFYLMNRR